MPLRFRYGAFTLSGRHRPFCYSPSRINYAVQAPGAHAPRFGSLPCSLAALHGITCFLFLLRLLSFQFAGFPSLRYGLAQGCMRASHAGFPHSDTSGSKGYLASPEGFSPEHRVFRRLLVPRHPPYALSWHDQADSGARAAVLRRHSVAGVGQSAFFLFVASRIWFVMNNRFRDYLGCLDLDILLDHFVFPCMRFSRYICDARRASSGEYEIRTRDLLLARQALSQLKFNPRLVPVPIIASA